MTLVDRMLSGENALRPARRPLWVRCEERLSVSAGRPAPRLVSISSDLGAGDREQCSRREIIAFTVLHPSVWTAVLVMVMLPSAAVQYATTRNDYSTRQVSRSETSETPPQDLLIFCCCTHATRNNHVRRDMLLHVHTATFKSSFIRTIGRGECSQQSNAAH